MTLQWASRDGVSCCDLCGAACNNSQMCHQIINMSPKHTHEHKQCDRLSQHCAWGARWALFAGRFWVLTTNVGVVLSEVGE